MKNPIINTTLIAILSFSTLSFASEVNNYDNEPESTKESTLAEATALLVEMNNESSGEDIQENVLAKYMNGEINADEGQKINTGEKSIVDIENDKYKMIDEIAEEEAKELIEIAKDKKELEGKEPKNLELAEKFARGEITAGEGFEIEKKMEEDKVSEATAEIAVKQASDKDQRDALNDESFISKIKGFFGQ